MLLVSDGFKALVLDAFPDIFNGGAMQIYTSPRPSTPHDTPGGTMIGIVTDRGLPWTPYFTPYGLKFQRTGPYIVGDVSQSWQLLPNDFAGLGAAAWGRLLAPGDDGTPSIDRPRVDFDIGLKGGASGAELLLDSLTLTPRAATPVRYFLYTIPPIPGA